MKKIIYTCITGQYDILKDPLLPEDKCEYICFSEEPDPNLQVWQHRPLVKKFDNPTLTSRYHKTAFCNELDADLIIWQDGKVLLQASSVKIFKTNIFAEDLFVFQHSERNCIYDELRVVIALKKCDPELAKKQCGYYKSQNFYPQQGLYETCLMARKRSSQIDKMNKLWWDQICEWTPRDQLSLPYVLSKVDVNKKVVQYDYWKTKHFDVFPHAVFNWRHHIPLI